MIQSQQATANRIELRSMIKSGGEYYAVMIAFAILAVWICSIVLLMSLDISQLPTWGLLIAIAWQTFLYTGLFITAHDAMHGIVFPQNRKINDFIGTLFLILYAYLSYEELEKKHRLHHGHPASELDPDFHDGKHKNFFAWYVHFMQEYWNWPRFVALVATFHTISYTLPISEVNLSYFWVIPSLLSSLQLFYFGSYLPHREPQEGYSNRHNAQTTRLPIFWSFITCYHFGYHEEHHEYPYMSWWQLPKAYKMNAKSL
jgi:beta-carotene ketolase (CrtW type)